jgi:hypothetical protein
MRDYVLDGNAVAGTLHTAFGDEMTDVDGECANCGAVAKVGALVAYTHAPGIVLRCPSCTEVMVRIAETPSGTVVDVRAKRLPVRPQRPRRIRTGSGSGTPF